jgi:hypothetical protein
MSDNRSALKVVCSWCGFMMRAGPPAPVSHGCCPSCVEALQLGEERRQAALDAIRAAALVVGGAR